MTTNDQCLTVTVEAAAALCGISRNSAYLAIRSGQLPSIRIGHRILIPRVALEKMLAEVSKKTGDNIEG